MKKLLFILSYISLVFAQSTDFSFYSENEENKNMYGYINKEFINKDFESILRFNPVFFNSSNNEVKEKSQKYLVEEIVEMIKNNEERYKNATINIVGYTDLVQTKIQKVNQSSWFPTYPNDLTKESSAEISLLFANYVKEQLIKNEIPENIINVIDGSDSSPLFVGVDDETRELNYRAMVTLYLEKDANTDSDRDGVIDTLDKCEHTPLGHSVNEYGCSEILNLTVFYDANSSNIQKVSSEKLTKVINFMNKYKYFKVLLYGHTSSEGKKLDNQILSEKRALSIRNYLMTQGINSSRISIYGRSSSEPLESNDTKEGRDKNRRVEIKLY